MTDTAFVIVQHCDTICIRSVGSYPQEIRVRLSDLTDFINKILSFVPRDAHGAVVFDQIIAAARAHRPRDRTNADRQRRFRQRCRARQREARSSVRGTAPA